MQRADQRFYPALYTVHDSDAAGFRFLRENDMKGILLVRFSIEKLNELPGPYEFQKGFLIGRSVPARLLEGMTIFEGDTFKTLLGQEYLTLVAIAGDREILQKDIEPRIMLNEDISNRKADPLTKLVTETKEPLSQVGTVQRGTLEETGWCSKGFLYAWN
jgi:hypothetical protein